MGDRLGCTSISVPDAVLVQSSAVVLVVVVVVFSARGAGACYRKLFDSASQLLHRVLASLLTCGGITSSTAFHATPAVLS
ncbi:hypothetical protein DE146DRAFT_656902 [Phaeosphaeria sp. MPI-PUGE-AT-0046c]|nr:hypothetical protein DE146DRAFT_656902 [Phaeosphaeria sp. MPI-PUGE-AT-0046c]